MARGVDTGQSDIDIVVEFVKSPRGFAWAGRMAEIENAVYTITGFLCDAIEDGSYEAERLAPVGERIELFGDRP